MPYQEITIPGRTKPIKAWYSVPTPDLHFILSYMLPGVDFALQAEHVDYAFPTQNLDQMPAEPDVLAVVDEEKIDREKNELIAYADSVGLRHGADIVDPNSPINAPIADSSAPLDELRQEAGKGRAKMQWGKRNGNAGGPTVPGSVSRCNAAQQVEEDVAEATINAAIQIESGSFSTSASVSSFITAIPIVY